MYQITADQNYFYFPRNSEFDYTHIPLKINCQILSKYYEIIDNNRK